jgi:uncharacterized protein (DUF111 family)
LDGLEITESKREIDNYFSVYYIEEKHFNSSSLKGIIEKGLKNEHERLKDRLIENLLKEGVQEGQAEKIFIRKATSISS